MLTRHIRDIMKIPKSLDENFHRISEAKIYNSQPVLLHLFWNTFKDLNNSQSQPLSRFPTHPRLASRGWRRRCQEFESIQRWFESKKSVLWTWSFLWTGPPGICKEDKYFIMMWSKDRWSKVHLESDSIIVGIGGHITISDIVLGHKYL